MKLKKLFTILLILIISCTFQEKEVKKHSDLREWGLLGKVKELKSYFYKSVSKSQENQWDRMTITYYNSLGMIDSLKVFSSKNSLSSTFMYVNIKDTIKAYLISNSDTILFSKRHWESKFNYITEIFNENKIETSERCYLDEKFRIKEIKREHYNLDGNSIEFTSAEKFYFNENNNLDSIRAFSNQKMNELTLNIDIEFDGNKNPVKSSKKVGELEPYLITREFSYY
jgi:hypothetical protein